MDLHEIYSDRTVLVTGGAGFLGSHLTDALVEHGAKVRALDDLSDGHLANLALAGDRIVWHEVSVVDGDLDAPVAGCDYVFHLAANASVPRSSADPVFDFEVNVVGTHRVMEACRRAEVGTLLFTSSAGVYGEPLTEAMDEDHPLRPQSPYGGSKLAAEFLLDSYGRCFDRDHRRVRIFNTFGPRQRKYVLFDWLEKLRSDPTRLEIIGTGEQIRTYNYVADTVDALLRVAAQPKANGIVLNIGGQQQISIRELAELLVQQLGIDPPEITFTGQSWPGDIVRLYGDVSRVRALGCRETVGLGEGINRLIAWHRDEYAPPW